MKKSFYKKDYLSGLRCSKNLYLQEHNPELAQIDNNALAIMTMGREFELTVRKLIAPGGLDLTFVCSTEEELISRTRSELKKENVTLYQATFQNDTNDTAMIDVLIKKGNHIHLIEIKMVTKLEDVHYYDSTYQSYVASTSGFKIDKVSVAYINKNYLREGALTADFMILEDITKPSKKLTVQLPQKVERFKSILKRKEVPEKSIGVYCMEPHQCQFKNHCFEQLPTNNIFELKSIRLSRKLGLYYKGINTIEQLADKERNLTDRQRIHVVCAVENKKAIQWDAIENWFKPLKKAKGIYFMDFETIAPSIPLDDGYKSKPFTQIPFQYSCHYLDKKTQQLTHMDFLAQPGSDYRRNFIKSLLLDINLFDEDAPVLVYNKTFEKTRLKELAELFPEFEDDIQAVINRLVDMMDVFRSWYYHPAFKGGFSIKVVLPALCPDLDYSDLEIKNGSFAASEFIRSQNLTGEDAANLKHALREYCKRDTYAMVRLLEQLEKEYYEYMDEKETLKQVI
jgi:predicted RecB family nuclease